MIITSVGYIIKLRKDSLDIEKLKEEAKTKTLANEKLKLEIENLKIENEKVQQEKENRIIKPTEEQLDKFVKEKYGKLFAEEHKLSLVQTSYNLYSELSTEQKHTYEDEFSDTLHKCFGVGSRRSVLRGAQRDYDTERLYSFSKLYITFFKFKNIIFTKDDYITFYIDGIQREQTRLCPISNIGDYGPEFWDKGHRKIKEVSNKKEVEDKLNSLLEQYEIFLSKQKQENPPERLS